MASADLIAVSSMLGKILAATTLATTGATAVYTVPANTGAIVKKALVCNTTTSPATITVALTKSGGSAVTVVNAYSVGANDTVDLTELAGLCLGPGDIVTCTAGTAAALNVALSGTENS